MLLLLALLVLIGGARRVGPEIGWALTAQSLTSAGRSPMGAGSPLQGAPPSLSSQGTCRAGNRRFAVFCLLGLSRCPRRSRRQAYMAAAWLQRKERRQCRRSSGRLVRYASAQHGHRSQEVAAAAAAAAARNAYWRRWSVPVAVSIYMPSPPRTLLIASRNIVHPCCRLWLHQVRYSAVSSASRMIP